MESVPTRRGNHVFLWHFLLLTATLHLIIALTAVSIVDLVVFCIAFFSSVVAGIACVDRTRYSLVSNALSQMVAAVCFVLVDVFTKSMPTPKEKQLYFYILKYISACLSLFSLVISVTVLCFKEYAELEETHLVRSISSLFVSYNDHCETALDREHRELCETREQIDMHRRIQQASSIIREREHFDEVISSLEGHHTTDGAVPVRVSMDTPPNSTGSVLVSPMSPIVGKDEHIGSNGQPKTLDYAAEIEELTTCPQGDEVSLAQNEEPVKESHIQVTYNIKAASAKSQEAATPKDQLVETTPYAHVTKPKDSPIQTPQSVFATLVDVKSLTPMQMKTPVSSVVNVASPHKKVDDHTPKSNATYTSLRFATPTSQPQRTQNLTGSPLNKQQLPYETLSYQVTLGETENYTQESIPRELDVGEEIDIPTLKPKSPVSPFRKSATPTPRIIVTDDDLE